MQSQMITSRLGGELLSYKLDGVEKIHQGQECIDAYGKVYWTPAVTEENYVKCTTDKKLVMNSKKGKHIVTSIKIRRPI